VLLTGGEPLLFEGLAELTATITALGVSTDLNSTLWLMTPQRARELADAGLTEASVAIEGPEPIHDQMHGQPGAFARLRAGVRMLQEVGVAVDGSLCVTPVNLGHVQRAIQQAAEWGLGSFTVSRMLPVGHGLNSAGPTVSEGELAELHASLAAARAGAEGIPVRCVGLLGAPHPEHCRQGVTLIGIRADGGLVPCVLTRCELPHLPRPQAVGLARAVGAMRAALERTEPVLCFGSPTAWSSP
jgi:MoaA/NifB/PqqE/SkfB family radical SAM enzyme